MSENTPIATEPDHSEELKNVMSVLRGVKDPDVLLFVRQNVTQMRHDLIKANKPAKQPKPRADVNMGDKVVFGEGDDAITGRALKVSKLYVTVQDESGAIHNKVRRDNPTLKVVEQAKTPE